MRHLFIQSFLLCGLISSAQTIQSYGKTSAWEQYDDDISFEALNSRSCVKKSKQIRITPTEVVFPVSYDGSSGVFVFDKAKLKYGIVKLNSKGEQLWEQRVEGLLINISRIGDHILAVTTDQGLQRHVAKQVKATLLDGQTGAVLKQAVLLDNLDGKFVEVKVFNGVDGKINALMFRFTGYKGGLALNIEKKFKQSERIELHAIDRDLKLQLVKKITPSEDLRYRRSEMSEAGDLFMLYQKDRSVIVERYQAGSNQPEVMTTPYDFEESSYKDEFVLGINPRYPAQLYCLMDSWGIIRCAVFKFDAKQVVVKDEVLNDDYAARLNEIVVETEDFKRRKKIKEIKHTTVKFLDFLNERIVVAKEVALRELGGAHIDYETIVSVYDADFNPKKDFVLPKKYSSNAGGYDDSYYLFGGQLHILSNHNQGLSKARTVYAHIDLNDLQLKKMDFLKDAKQNKVADSPLLPSNTIWFPEVFLVDRRNWHVAKGLDSNTSLELVSYN